MRKYYFLLLVIVIAVVIRFFQLGVNPPSLTWDEAAWGYNAYTLGIDGKDEFGRFLPMVYLESFGDFKPPVYAYLALPGIKFFGLNEFATRLPSALVGVLTVLAAYFLVKEIFPKQKYLPEISSFILAISPWHIMLSRAAFEANAASFFICLGVWLFFLALRKNIWIILPSAIFFIISMYTFNSARIVSPLLVIILIVVFRKKFFRFWKVSLLTIVVCIFLLLPLARFIITPQASLRFREVNIFSDGSVIGTSNQEIANDNNLWWSKILHNRRWLYLESFLRHYFDHFNPNYLFIKGDGNPKFSTQSVGQLYLWDIPFFVIGLFWLVRKKEGYWWFIFIWMLLGIIPAATARETPHALRTEAIIPTMQIITAYGVVQFLRHFEERSDKAISSGLPRSLRSLAMTFGLFSFLLLNVLYFLHGYYVHYAREYSGEWQYGYKESISYVSSVMSNYDNIYITDELGRPYVYYAFYFKMKPDIFRASIKVSRDSFGFVNVTTLGKLHFLKSLPIANGSGKSLFINTPGGVPASAHVQKAFLLKNNNPALVAYTL